MEPAPATIPQPIISGIDNAATVLDVDVQSPISSTEAQSARDAVSMSYAPISLTTFSPTEIVSLVTDSSRRSTRIKEIAMLLRTLMRMGECQLDLVDSNEFTSLVDQICEKDIPLYNRPAVVLSKAPIKFKDAVGRKFSFPWNSCKTWKGMEELINQAFLHVDVIGPHVHEGHYDLVGPDGEIILPQVWEEMIQPDWAITMHMWPMPELPSLPPGGPLPPPPPPPPNTEMFKSSHLLIGKRRPRRRRQPSVDAGSYHETPLVDLQTPQSPSLTGTLVMNTGYRLSSETDHGSTQSASQTSCTSISDEDVVEE
ncbi:hypothetical protein BKA58DRAFT_51878 [Alternaria rosae]|uniref:uncharacterized protein n=1 Tax=Alternaria rosae TaxID=1187941 RepID=UPI001E8DB3A2|nr:uncharacterized protein BKA58DRAFT_51878 [Alternaria rosae]KAH6859006.1 hypothetical protein BKA58DRAFT_51878 [Alternaria rosae]